MPRGKAPRIKFLGRYVCLSAATRLLGIGTERAAKMRRSVREGLDGPVLDGRMIGESKFASRPVSQKRELVHNFLHGLYMKYTESMPEAPASMSSALVTSKVRGLHFHRAQGKRPRIFHKRDARPDADLPNETRYLPPGNYVDYLRLLQSEQPAAAVSLKLFMRVPRQLAGLVAIMMMSTIDSYNSGPVVLVRFGKRTGAHG